MEISLLRAKKLENRIKEMIPSLFNAETEIPLFISTNNTEVIDELHNAKSAFEEQNQNILKLIETCFSIRRKIEITNEKAGINELINKKEQIQAKLDFYARLKELKTSLVEEIMCALSTKRALFAKTNDANATNLIKVTASFLTKEEKEALLAQAILLQNELEEIEEQLAQKIIEAKIVIDENEKLLLQANGLINLN